MAFGDYAVSATIVPFLRDASFDPDVTSEMGRAYDKVLRTLRDQGRQPLEPELIARKIIDIATTGERDAERMCKRALAALGFQGES
jgi:hypothetical protein